MSYEDIVQTTVRDAAMYESTPWGSKYTQAIKDLEKLANKGDTQAQYGLGAIYSERSRYHDGSGNNEEASQQSLAWLVKAANNGHKDALYELGVNPDQDEQKSKGYILKAFHAGSAKAKDEIVSSVVIQLLIPQMNEVYSTLRLRAKSGDTEAQKTLSSSSYDYLEDHRFDGYKKAMKLSDTELINLYQKDYILPQIDQEERTLWWNKLSENSTDKLPYTVGELWENKDYDKLLSLLDKYSSNGNYRAKAWIGLMYIGGYGVLKDYKKALRLFRESEEISKGDGLVADIERSGELQKEQLTPFYKWYMKQAEKGDVQAQVDLARMYEYGNSYIEKNSSKSIGWLEKAAALDYLKASYELAQAYTSKYSVDKKSSNSLKKALYWYAKAANNGDINAMNYLGNIYLMAEFGVQNYFEARRWFGKAAALNDPYALQQLGKIYYHGLGVKKDSVQALKYFEKANSLPSQNFSVTDSNPMLQYMYYSGEGVEKNNTKVIELFLNNNGELQERYSPSSCIKILADLGDTFMEEQCLFTKTRWQNPDFRQNLNQFLLFAENGSWLSQLAVGNIYYDAGDNKNAKKWLEKVISDSSMVDYFKWEATAREHGLSLQESMNSYDFIYKLFLHSYIKMGKIYENGLDVDKNMSLSYEYNERAAELVARNATGSLRHSDRNIDKKLERQWLLEGAKMGHQQSAYFLILDLYRDSPAIYALADLLNITPYSSSGETMTAEEIELGQQLAHNPEELWKRIEVDISKMQ